MKRLTNKQESGFEPIPLVEAERAGEVAFEQGLLATDCPYAFIVSPCWDTKDYARFDREFKPKLNAWMRGWIQAKAADAARRLESR